MLRSHSSPSRAQPSLAWSRRSGVCLVRNSALVLKRVRRGSWNENVDGGKKVDMSAVHCLFGGWMTIVRVRRLQSGGMRQRIAGSKGRHRCGCVNRRHLLEVLWLSLQDPRSY